jgi:hypothetical protein
LDGGDSVTDWEARVRERYGVAEEACEVLALRAGSPIDVDGRLDEPCWAGAAWTPRFGDAVTGAPALYDTRAAVLWDDDRLYVGFRIEEPFVRASLTERDSLIWYDNDIELFVAGDDAYWELEVNALGTIYEVLHVWADAYARGTPFDLPELDLRRPSARGFTGNVDPDHWDWDGFHPRGNRWAFLDWDLPGLEVGVAVDGTVNDDTDVDRGWSVEIAVPWDGLALVAAERQRPPRDGDVWRMFLARYEQIELNGHKAPPVGWAASRHGLDDAHVPELYSRVRFSADVADTAR